MGIDFKSIEDERPEYGEPVLIAIGDTVQNITYMRDGADETEDWFEPYFFDSDDELKIWQHKVTKWAYIPEI